MRQDIPLLDNVRVAAPCPANWNEMVGGERVRYCRACEKNVYNLSEMTRKDAEELLETHEGRLCIRYYQRADGKIITQNCPVGLQALRRAYLRTAARVSAICGALFGSAATFMPVYGGAAEHRSSNSYERDINRLEKRMVEEKALLNDAHNSMSANAREEAQEMIEYNRQNVKKDLEILQARAEKGDD